MADEPFDIELRALGEVVSIIGALPAEERARVMREAASWSDAVAQPKVRSRVARCGFQKPGAPNTEPK